MNGIWGLSAAVVLANMTGFYLVAAARRDNSLVDIAWALGPLWIALTPLAAGHPLSGLQLLVAFLVLLWSLRLGGFIAWRKRGRPEDPRYAALRRKWGGRAARNSFFYVFALQGALQWLVSLPVLAVLATDDPRLTPVSAGGLILGLGGLAIETVADWQKQRFRRITANRGRLMDSGLWRYSRHPNYFGESLVWWGLAGTASGCPHGVFAFASPLLLTLLLLFVSGIPPLERPLAGRPDFEAYKRRTPAFVPWFVKERRPPAGTGEN